LRANKKNSQGDLPRRDEELGDEKRSDRDRYTMTSRGTKYWDTGAIPLIAPEMLGDIIAALADIALVVDERGIILSVITNPTNDAIDDLSHWKDRDVRTILRVESVPKFDRALDSFLNGNTTAQPLQLNHTDDLHEWGFPVNYTLHRIGPEGSILLLGHDLRPISEMQQQLVKAQMALEQDYEQQREFDTRFRVLMEAGRDAMAFVSMSSGRIIEANGLAARLLGRDKNDIVGLPFAQEFDGRRKGELIDALAASAIAEGPNSISVETRKSGKTLKLYPTVFRASGERIMLCRLDVNESDTSESGQVPQNLLGLFNQGADAIAFTDGEGTLASVNEAFLELTGAAHALNVKGRSLSDYLQRGHIDLRVLLENAARVGHIRLYSTKMEGEHGAPRAVEISATYLNDVERPGYAFILRDASRADAVRVSTAPVGEENVKSVSRQSLYVKLRKYALLNKGG